MGEGSRRSGCPHPDNTTPRSARSCAAPVEREKLDCLLDDGPLHRLISGEPRCAVLTVLGLVDEVPMSETVGCYVQVQDACDLPTGIEWRNAVVQKLYGDFLSMPNQRLLAGNGLDLQLRYGCIEELLEVGRKERWIFDCQPKESRAVQAFLYRLQPAGGRLRPQPPSTTTGERGAAHRGSEVANRPGLSL